jgi:hypothetical protein
MAIITNNIYNCDPELVKVLEAIVKKLNNMPTKAEFDAALAEINEATNNIAADIERLAGQIGSGLTADEEASVLAEFQGVANRLKSIADTTPETETPPTEPQG